MGFIDNANAMSNMEASKTAELMLLTQLLQMGWPTLDRDKAIAKINKHLKYSRLHL